MGSKKSDLQVLIGQLKSDLESGRIDSYTYVLLMELMEKVNDSYFAKNETMKTEVHEIMGGKVLELESVKIYNKGINEGINQGIIRGRSEDRAEIIELLEKEGVDERIIDLLRNPKD